MGYNVIPGSSRPLLREGMLLLGALLTLWHLGAMAEEPEGSSESEVPTEEILSILDAPRDLLSEQLVLFSERVDRLFSDTGSYYGRNNSYAHISLATVFAQGNTPQYVPNAFLYLALPRTQSRYSVLVQTESASDLDGNTPDILPGVPQRETDALVLQGRISGGDNWRFYMGLGVALTEPVDPFFRFTFRQTRRYDNWRLLWRASAFRFDLQGEGAEGRLRIDRPVNDDFQLRQDNLLTWYQQAQVMERAHSLSLYQKMEAVSALIYTVGTYSERDPVDNVYYAQIRFKRLFHSTWLYYEFTPEVLYAESNGYNPTPRFTLKFEAILGNP